jgi:hypothetical protein
MPVDPQIQTLLDKGTGVPATHTLTVAAERDGKKPASLFPHQPRSVDCVSTPQ